MTLYTVLIAVAAISMVSADVSELGYHYKVPHTSYGVPSYQIGGNTGGYNTGYTSGNGAGYNYKGSSIGGYQGNFGQQNTGYQNEFQSSGSTRGINSGTGYQSGSGYLSTSGHQSGSGYQPGSDYQSGGSLSNVYYKPGDSTYKNNDASFVQPSYHFSGNTAQSGYQALNQYQSSNEYQSSAVKKYQEYYNQVQQPAQVYKHFYVHAAPEDHEPPKPRQPIVLPPPQKHYKIIFIKTPSPAYAPPQIIPAQQQNEEKTIVYVLVKKPEEIQNIVLPKVEQKPPSKPEVYFIKYNTKEGSQAVIDNIVNDYNKGQESVSFSGAGVSSGLNFGSSSISDASNVLSGQSSVESSGSQSFNQVVGSQTDNQVLSDSIGSQVFGDSGSVSGGDQSSNTVVSTASSGGVNGEYDSSVEASGVSSTSTVGSSALDVSFDNVNTLSTSQGIPHETYGIPKFRIV